MTPDELRKLADEATPLEGKVDRLLSLGFKPEDVRLWVLAPDLARLCAEMAMYIHAWDIEDAEQYAEAQVLLAKLFELNNGAEEPPALERT